MKRNIICFIFIVLASIGLAYETQSVTYGSMSGTEYGIVGLATFLLVLYAIPSIWVLLWGAKKWQTSWVAVVLAVIGGGFIAGWMASFANTYFHDMILWAFPKSTFWEQYEPAIAAPLLEEPLKLLPLALVLPLVPVRKLKSLFLLGMASGLGFQLVEDFAYIRSDLPDGFSYTISGILGRIVLAPASHWVYTGIAMLGLVLIIRSFKGEKQYRIIGWAYFLGAFALHFVRNSPFTMIETELPFTAPLVTALSIFVIYLAFQTVAKLENE